MEEGEFFAVASGAVVGVDDGDPFADEAVEEAAFAAVGEAH